MEIDKIEVGKRLREFAKLHGGVGKLAELLDMSIQALSGSYISGKNLPGAEVLARLMELGCDINWLLTGQTDKTINVKKGIYNKSPIKGTGNTVTNQMGNDVEVQVLREKVRLLEEQNKLLDSVITDLRKQNNYLLNKLMEGENK